MRRKDATPYLLRAIEVTGGLVEWEDRRPPTWDGARWHFARISSVQDALHEVAHWIVAPPDARAVPNFGLGTDPDNGPRLSPDPCVYVDAPDRPAMAETLFALLERDPDRALEIVSLKTSREEELASVVTVILLRLAGLPWASTMQRVFGALVKPAKMARTIHELAKAERGVEAFWGFVEELEYRGVDLSDPLAPFVAAHADAWRAVALGK